MIQSRKRAHARNEYVQFTVEKEENGYLPFLDSLLTRESDGSISTSVYRKKTHTGQYLQFSSHHPLAHKKSVITTLFHHATALSSDMVERVQGLHKVGQSGRTLAMRRKEHQRAVHNGERHECLGYCRACLERASPHGLVSSGGGGYGTVPVPQIAVGIVAHS